MFDLDAELRVSAQSLKLQAQRTQVLASNIANADTPNYKARDIDFRAVLAATNEASPALGMTTTTPAHITTSAAADAAMSKYRVPLAPSLDGNTVDIQAEQAAFAETTVRYRSSLEFVNDTFRGLLLAITGQE
jgi:flagellar basal-body rod protein FlgB